MSQALLKMIRPLIPRRVKGWLYKLSQSEHVEGTIYYHVNLLKKLGYNPDMVLDIGAFRGEWTQGILPIFPKARFVMFEPQDDKAPILSKLTSVHPNVSHVKTLVGKLNTDGVEFFEMESGSSIYEEQTTHPRTRRRYPMKTLDTILKEFPKANDIFIKLDVQGAEKDVLEGASETLRRTNFILLEASVLNYNAQAPLLDELVAYLRSMGFVLFDICDMRRKANGTLFQVDLIFSRINGDIRTKENFVK